MRCQGRVCFWACLLALGCADPPLVLGDRDPWDYRSFLAAPSRASCVPSLRMDLAKGRPTLRPYDLHALSTGICTAAAAYDLSPHLLRAVAWVESRYDPDALSPVGAEGVFQFMPATRAWLDPDHPGPHPYYDAHLAARYLVHLLEMFRENMAVALTAYNRGPGNTRAVLAKHGGLPLDVYYFYAGKVLEEAAWQPSDATLSGGE